MRQRIERILPSLAPSLVPSLVPWLAAALWLALPFTTGTLVGDALSGRSRPVQVTATVLAWAVWGAGQLAAVAPHPIALTVLRCCAAPVLAVSVWAALTAGSPASTGLVAVAVAAAAALLAGSAAVGHRAINGPAYPNERRFLLRPPGPVLLGPAPLALALGWSGVVGAPLLLAARSWVLGTLVLAAGVAAAVVAFRSLHGLTRRFVVFVPAGLVVHDPVTLRDPVLFPRSSVEAVHLAPAETDSLDLTQHALGLAVEVLLRDKLGITLVVRGEPAGREGGTARFLVSPTRPGLLLEEARRRRYAA